VSTLFRFVLVMPPIAAALNYALPSDLSESSMRLREFLLIATSGASFVLTIAAVVGWMRRTFRRSVLDALLIAIAGLVSIPAAFLAWVFVNHYLPVTKSERQAIAVAEEFVARNGFTAAGHPSDLPVLQTDIWDPLLGREAVLKSRLGSVRSHAGGVASAGLGTTVLFQSPKPEGYVTFVEVHGGTAHIPHSPLSIPDWYFKRFDLEESPNKSLERSRER
jgi:hypothetical protein